MEHTTPENAGAEQTREIRANLQNAMERAREVCQRLQERSLAAAKTTDTAIREHPYQALGIGFGIGLLVGVLLGRSRRD